MCVAKRSAVGETRALQRTPITPSGRIPERETTSFTQEIERRKPWRERAHLGRRLDRGGDEDGRPRPGCGPEPGWPKAGKAPTELGIKASDRKWVSPPRTACRPCGVTSTTAPSATRWPRNERGRGANDKRSSHRSIRDLPSSRPAARGLPAGGLTRPATQTERTLSSSPTISTMGHKTVERETPTSTRRWLRSRLGREGGYRSIAGASSIPGLGTRPLPGTATTCCASASRTRASEVREAEVVAIDGDIDAREDR